ncbi:MAG: hypothetical protein D6808_07545, partial [Candidatus Dadabacteria bacterium]
MNRHWTDTLYSVLSALFAFFIPIKLSLAYCFLIPLILLSIYRELRLKRQTSKETGILRVYQPFAIWLAVSLISCFFAVNPFTCSVKILRLFAVSYIMKIAYDAAASRSYSALLWPLAAGQGVASLYTVIAPSLPKHYQGLLIGKVTESGQLSLTLIICLGMFFHLYYRNKLHSYRGRFIGLFILMSFLLSSVGFLSHSQERTFYIASAVASFFAVVFALFLVLKEDKKKAFALISLILPLLFSALLLNLKRGPWLGVFCAITLMLAVYYRKWVVPIVACIVVIFISISPVRERIKSSYN